MTTEIYHGTRTKTGCVVTVNNQPLPTRLDLANHSPDGFEWGYNGSGPAQLALAILAYHCRGEEQRALNNYQEFKDLVTSHIPSNNWGMDREFIEQHLRAIEQQSRRSAA